MHSPWQRSASQHSVFLYCKLMAPSWKSHVVLSGSIEHALLKSASVESPRTRRQLPVIAMECGLRRYDDQTVVTALQRLTASGFFKSIVVREGSAFTRLTPPGEQVRQVLRQTSSFDSLGCPTHPTPHLAFA